MALFDVLRALLLAEPLADFLAGVVRLDVAEVAVEPVARRAARAASDNDLDDVAVFEGLVERHEASVHLRADAVVAEIGVDAVSEIDRRRARGEVFDLSLGRVDEDLVLEDVCLERFYEV